MDPLSLLRINLIGGAFAFVLLICLLYSIHVTWPLSHHASRRATLPILVFGVIGGLLFMSPPFYQLANKIMGVRWYGVPTQMFFSTVGIKGADVFSDGWVLDFVVGYASFAFAWKVYSRNQKRDGG